MRSHEVSEESKHPVHSTHIHPKDNLSFLKLVPSPLPTLSHLLNVLFFFLKKICFTHGIVGIIGQIKF